MKMFEGLFGKPQPQPQLEVEDNKVDEMANSVAIEVAGPVSSITHDILNNIYHVMSKLQTRSDQTTFADFLESSKLDYPDEYVIIEKKIRELQTLLMEDIEQNEPLTVFIEKMEAKNLKANEVVHP